MQLLKQTGLTFYQKKVITNNLTNPKLRWGGWDIYSGTW